MMVQLSGELVIALMLPLFMVVLQVVESFGGDYRSRATSQCILRISSLIVAREEPTDEAIRALRSRYSNNILLEAVTFVLANIYGRKLHRLALIVEVCKVDFWALRATKRLQWQEKIESLIAISQLSHLGTIADEVGCGACNAEDTGRFAAMLLVASRPERAVQYVARLKTSLSLHDVVVLMQLMKRSGQPIAYTPLLISTNRNLQYLGICLCEELAMSDAEESLQRLVESDDDEVAVAALRALCTLRCDLTLPSVVSGMSRLLPHMRATIVRHAVQSCYSLKSCAHLLSDQERATFAQQIASYKCKIVCN